jgi:hypothetical protein
MNPRIREFSVAFLLADGDFTPVSGNQRHRTGMKQRIAGLIILTLSTLVGVAHAALVTVTVRDDGTVANAGAAGTFYWAITNAGPGDTIAFNIPGPGPHYLQIPPGGFPLIYRKHNLIIDGYTQPGASTNSNPITAPNNANLQIVVDGRNGNGRAMSYTEYGTTVVVDPPIDNSSCVLENAGFSETDFALLGIYRSTNVNIRGLAFLGTFAPAVIGDQKGICFAHDYEYDTTVLDRLAYAAGSDAGGHVNGCWFGVDPTNQTVAGVSGWAVAIAHYGHRDQSGGNRPDLPNVGLIVGVAPGSANPRAEFNVFVGLGYALDGENIRTRVSGNFFGVMPDGVTDYNMVTLNPGYFLGGQFAFRRYDDTEPIIIGTDGDGVNDADEGNLFGPLDAQQNQFDFSSSARKPYIIAGNRFGLAVDGTRWVNNAFQIGTFRTDQGSQVRFGTDGNGVSDDLEANQVYNNNVFATLFPGNPPFGTPTSLFNDGWSRDSTTKDGWYSIRGNIMVNNFPAPNPDDPGSAGYYLQWWTNYLGVTAAGIPATIPTLSASSTVSTLIGTFAVASSDYYTNAAIIDVYEADPEGLTNGALFALPDFPAGFAQGRKYLGGFLDNGAYDSNPAAGAFSLNIAGLGIAHGTKITAAVTYSSFGKPTIASITHSGSTTTLSWTNPGNANNGGPYVSTTAGGPSSGFGIQRASSVSGPWATVAFTQNSSISLTDGASTSFYRVVRPIAGPTTVFAQPVTLP